MKRLTMCIITFLALSVPIVDTQVKSIETLAIDLYPVDESNLIFENFIVKVVEGEILKKGKSIEVIDNINNKWDKAVVIYKIPTGINSSMFILATYVRFNNDLLLPHVQEVFKETPLVPLLLPNIQLVAWDNNDEKEFNEAWREVVNKVVEFATTPEVSD